MNIKIENKDYHVVVGLGIAEALLSTAINHLWGNLISEQENGCNVIDLKLMLNSLETMKRKLEKYNDEFDILADKSVPEDEKDKVADYTLLLLTIIDKGINEYDSIKKVLKEMGYITEIETEKMAKKLGRFSDGI